MYAHDHRLGYTHPHHVRPHYPSHHIERQRFHPGKGGSADTSGAAACALDGNWSQQSQQKLIADRVATLSTTQASSWRPQPPRERTSVTASLHTPSLFDTWAARVRGTLKMSRGRSARGFEGSRSTREPIITMMLRTIHNPSHNPICAWRVERLEASRDTYEPIASLDH